MVDPQHPLTPPKELINAWRAEGYHQDYCEADDYLYHKIAEWGWQQRFVYLKYLDDHDT